jgi:hypothetical protein
MSNALPDINWALKTLQLNDIDDTNNKVIQVRNTHKNTIDISSTGALFTGNSLMITNNKQFTPFSVGFTPQSFNNDKWYIWGITFLTECDIYYIDDNYDEQVVRKVCPVNVFVQILPGGIIRWVNKFIKVSTNVAATTKIMYEPEVIIAGGVDLTSHQISGQRGYNSIYMVPRGKGIRLNSIDYYKVNGLCNLSLLKYPRGVNKPTVILTINGINGVYMNENIQTDIIGEMGDLFVWYNINPGNDSTTNTLNSTFEIVDL